MQRELDDRELAEVAAAVARPLPWEPPLRPRGWRTSPRTKRDGRLLIAIAAAVWCALVARASPPDRGGVAVSLGLCVALIAVLAPGGIRDALRSRARAARAGRHPGEPWFADHPWDPRGTSVSAWKRIFAPRSRRRKRGRWFLRIFVIYVCLMDISSRGPPWIAGTVVGVLASVLSWRLWRELGIGGGHVWYSRFPFHPGERVTLYVGMSAGGATFERAAFYLRAVVEGSGGSLGVPNSTHAVRELRQHRPPGLLPGPGTDVELSFDVPAAAAGTSLSAVDPHYWVLDVVANTSAGPYVESFLIPIYERPAA